MTTTTQAASKQATNRADQTQPGRAATDQAAQSAEARALAHFIRAQTLNTGRHLAALRPFQSDEFGSGPASPSAAHVRAANELVAVLRGRLHKLAMHLGRAASASAAAPTQQNLQQLNRLKEQAGQWVKSIEKTWDFYLELFGQRQARFADWLLACDRIALECYQAIYTGLGTARSIPSPGPLCYVATGFGPATFRRGVPLSKLLQRANPFPVIQLPYHRLVNPWTLGAIHHEVSHNIQSDLGLWGEVPRRLAQRLHAAGMPALVVGTWARWHKEIWADLCGLLLGGPANVASLTDVVAMSPRSTLSFNPAGVHPTSYLRVLISVELLRRMGFPEQAAAFGRMWVRMYPSPYRSGLPRAMLDTFAQANALVVDTICFQPYHQLGGKSLAHVVCFSPLHEAMTREAGARIAVGTDPGIIPARFLVGATRWAIDQNLGAPERIADHFYQALVRR
jgi:hypothetical protein